MKAFRAITLSLLVLCGPGVFSGCANGRQDSGSAYNPDSREDIKRFQKKPSPTEDMNALQKTGYYLGWISLECLYAFAAGNPSCSP